MIHKLIINCPNCKSNIIVSVDDDFSIVDIAYDDICKNKSNIKGDDIEFGIMKEGENIDNAS